MSKRKDRIIIDTNLWISFLLTKEFARLDKIFEDKTITLLFSQELLEEFITVASRPKFERYFSHNDLQQLLTHISFHAVFITITSSVQLCRDEKDNFLLALATDGEATHLITGDKDLLDLKAVGKTYILTMTSYLLDKESETTNR